MLTKSGVNRNHTGKGLTQSLAHHLHQTDDKASMQTGIKQHLQQPGLRELARLVGITRHHFSTRSQARNFPEASMHGGCPQGGTSPHVWGQNGLRLEGEQHQPRGSCFSFLVPTTAHLLVLISI